MTAAARYATVLTAVKSQVEIVLDPHLGRLIARCLLRQNAEVRRLRARVHELERDVMATLAASR